jgi:flagellar protein FlgJ
MSGATLSSQTDVSQRFALDTQGFEALKNQARAGNNQNTLQAAA